jgi:hypothetical protein
MMQNAKHAVGEYGGAGKAPSVSAGRGPAPL